VRFRQYFWRALLLRCPSCGQFTLVRRPLAIHEQCRNCGLFFVHDDGFWLGAWHVNYFIASLLAIVPPMVGVATGAWSTPFAVGYAAVVATFFPILFYWHAYSLWIATYYYCVPDDIRMGQDLPRRRIDPEADPSLTPAERKQLRAEEAVLDLEGDRRSRI
jgi:uncharacterized protein (DUF983 family)